MPQAPALAPCQVCCKVLPMGVTAPMPVMTTLRRIEIPSCLCFVVVQGAARRPALKGGSCCSSLQAPAIALHPVRLRSSRAGPDDGGAPPPLYSHSAVY